MNAAVQQQQQQRGWFARNVLWLLPCGCLTIIGVAVGGVFLIISVVMGAMKSSDAYKNAMTRARADQRVVAAFGTPIKEGTMVGGSINVSGGSGQASLAIPVSGPKGEGKVYVEATKSAGTWSFQKLLVQTPDGQTINLLEQPAAKEAPAAPAAAPAL